mgnify:CR=1 FL=1
MQSQKISISLPAELMRFIEHYQTANKCKSRSRVIEKALILLQEQELELAYQQANIEVDTDWDITIADGLVDETW